MKKALKVRIYPTQEQAVLINRTLGCCRQIYMRYGKIAAIPLGWLVNCHIILDFLYNFVMSSLKHLQ